MFAKFILPTTMLAAAFASSTAAAECGPLKLVNTVPLHVTDKRVSLPVLINGSEKTFILDTGGAVTQITAGAADALKLPFAETGFTLLDIYGNASTKGAKLDTFTLGRLQDRNTVMPIHPGTNLQQEGFAGLLAADYMGHYDIEFDFGGGKMNYFLTDHCEGKVVYWPTTAVAVVPMTFQRHHLRIPVVLDGQTFYAMIDTGATSSSIDSSEAQRVFNIAAPPSGDTTSGDDKLPEHVFNSLTLDGITISHPHMKLIANMAGSKDSNNGFITGSRTKKFDDSALGDMPVIIGMNILSKLHIYVAFGERKLYITPASAPAKP